MVINLRIIIFFTLFDIGFIDSAPCNQVHCLGPTCGVQIDDGNLNLNDVRPCRSDDIGASETTCKNGKRNIIYYWKPPAICQAQTNISLPDPLIGINCDINCDHGTRLTYDPSTQKSQCIDCAAGRYSIGGGLWFGPSWVPGILPPQFTSSCFIEKERYWNELKKGQECDIWGGKGAYIYSGMNKGVDNLDSTLELQIALVSDGMISFIYQIESEDKYDHFLFIVDDDIRLKTKTKVTVWTEFNATLSAGHHWLRWIYRKDPTISYGDDAIKLKEISITGIRNNDLECITCSPGRYQPNPGSISCDPCPAQTFSKTWGATECTPCEIWEMSNPGSSECEPNVACSEHDYFEEETFCLRNNTRSIKYHWLDPRKCYPKNFEVGKTKIGYSETNVMAKTIIFTKSYKTTPTIGRIQDWNQRYKDSVSSNLLFEITQVSLQSFSVNITNTGNSTGWEQDLHVYWEATGESISLPPTKRNVPCQQPICKPGYGIEREGNLGECEQCPDGTINTGGRNVCQLCASGQGTTDYSFYKDNWEAINVPRCDTLSGDLSPFCTKCKGNCGTIGWRSAHAFIDSGATHSMGAESSLRANLDTNAAPVYSAISFNYILSCGNTSTDSAHLDVWFDNFRLGRIVCNSLCDTEQKQVTYELPYHRVGNHAITWTFHKNVPLSSNFSHDCDFARLYNLTLTGGKLMGSEKYTTFGGAQSCEVCQKGSFSTSQDKKCRGCPGGKYSDEMGVGECTDCEESMVSMHPGSTSCKKCGQWTEPNQEASQCIPSCIMASADFNTYNLNAMPKFTHFSSETGNLTLGQELVEYYFSLCRPLHKTAPKAYEWIEALSDHGWTQLPHRITGDGTPSYVAIGQLNKETHTKGVNAGSFLSFFPSNASDGTKPHVKIVATSGSNVKCWTKNGDAITTQTKPLRTEIDVVCTPSIEVGQPMPHESMNPGENTNGLDETVLPCVSKFVWASKYGCPVCTFANLGYADGQCEDKTKLRSYLRIANCHSGVPLPDPEYIKCSPDGLVLSPEIVAGLSISASIFVIIITIGVIFLLKKSQSLSDVNRRLRDDYANLSGSTEMGTRSIQTAARSSDDDPL